MENRDDEKKNFLKENESQPTTHNPVGSESMKIPVIEERISIDKKVEETGKVRLTKKVHEEEKMVDVPSMQEEVEVERISINKFVDSPPPPVRQEGDTTIISVLREVTVIEKRLELVEEVRITKRKVKSYTTQRVTLRREEVDVERIKNDKINQDKV